MALDAGTPGRNQLAGDGLFSCGRPGHGVNRCSRVDTSFLILPRGWSVDIQDGQYRAVWHGGSMAQPVLGQRDRVVPFSPIGMGGSSPSLVPQCPELGDLGGGCALQGGIAGLRRN